MARGMGNWGAGLAALGIIGISSMLMNKDKMRKSMNKRAVRKNVNKAVKNVSSFFDDVGQMMK